MQITWEELKKRTVDLVGRDAQLEEDGEVYRGPIRNLVFLGENIDVIVDWAVCEVANGWRTHFALPNSLLMANMKFCEPWESGGVIEFHVPHIGRLKILPVGDNLKPPTEEIARLVKSADDSDPPPAA